MVSYQERLPEPEDGEDPYAYLQRLGVRGASRHLGRMFQSLSDLVPGLDQDAAAEQYEATFTYFGDQHNGIPGTYDLLHGIHSAMQGYEEQGIVMSPGEFLARLTVAPVDVQPESSVVAADPSN